MKNFLTTLLKSLSKKIISIFLCVFIFGALNAQKYCIPTPAPQDSSYYIDDFETTNGVISNISNLGTGMADKGYGDYSYQTLTVLPGDTFIFSISLGKALYVAIWIDWNNDGDFNDKKEEVFISSNKMVQFTDTIAVPSTQIKSGRKRIRIKTQENQSPKVCSPVNGNDIGETEDYSVMVLSDTTCLPPSNPIVSNKSFNHADIKWSRPSTGIPQNGYDIYYNMTGIPPTSDTLALDSTISMDTLYTLTNLGSPYYKYYTWIRSKCSLSKKSYWKFVNAFHTNCGTAFVPYQMDIKHASVPNLPNCMSSDVITGNSWKTDSIIGIGSGMKGHIFKYHGVNTKANSWIFTNPIYLKANVKYKLHFKYAGPLNKQKLRVKYGINNSVSAMTNKLYTDTNITLQAAKNHEVGFQVLKSQVYYIGFQAFSDANQGYLLLGDINVTECNPPIAKKFTEVYHGFNTFTFYPNNKSKNIQYSWDFGDGTHSTKQTPTHTFSDSGPHAVTLIIKNECGSDKIMDYNVLGIQQDTYNQNEEVKIFPNPTRSEVNIESTGKSKLVQIEVYNLMGQQVYQNNVHNKNAIKLNVHNYSPGIYVVKIKMANELWQQHKLEIIR